MQKKHRAWADLHQLCSAANAIRDGKKQYVHSNPEVCANTKDFSSEPAHALNKFRANPFYGDEMLAPLQKGHIEVFEDFYVHRVLTNNVIEVFSWKSPISLDERRWSESALRRNAPQTFANQFQLDRISLIRNQLSIGQPSAQRDELIP